MPSSTRRMNSGAARTARIAAAKAICRQCPAITACLDHALRVREPYGVWGGPSEDERAELLGLKSLRYPAPKQRPTDN
jgi:WhiB family redox-sensing transcriptional regulator